MKSLSLILLSFILSVQATSAEDKITDEQFYATTIREKGIEDQLLTSPLYKDCVDKFKGMKAGEKDDNNKSKEDLITTCVTDQINNAADDTIMSIAKETELVKIGTDETKTAKGIRGYLSEKIARAIYGKEYEPGHALKKLKYVDQTLFFDMYEEQLGKSIFLEVSNYCLENLRSEKAIELQTPIEKLTTDTACFNIKSDDKDNKNIYYNQCLSNLYEIEFPNIKIKKEDDQQLETLENLKIASQEEIKTKDAEYFQNKSIFCSSVIVDMCDRYKCNDLKEGESLKNKSQELFKNDTRCEELGSPPLMHKDTGAKACVVINRVRHYKKTILNVQKAREKLASSSAGKSKFGEEAFNRAYEARYQMGQGEGEDSIQEITTVTSTELTKNKKVSNVFLSEEDAEELRARCQKNPEDRECKALIDDDHDEKVVSINTALSAEAKIREEELKRLTQKEEIQEYLKKIGLEDLYDDSLEPEDLKTIISSHYSSERKALIEEMNKKLKKRPVVGETTKDSPTLLNDIEEKIETLEQKKTRVEVNLHYSNVVNSFLSIADKDNNIVADNALLLQREKQDYEKYDDENENISDYFSNVEQREGSSSSSKGQINYLQYIDNILGNSEN